VAAASLRSFPPTQCLVTALAIFLAFGGISGAAQSLPNSSSGLTSFDQVEMQIYLDQTNHAAKKSAQQQAQDKERIDSGVVSALDLGASNKAVEEYNHAITLLKAQNSKEAIKYLQKAIHDYPKFLTAYVALGQAYGDQGDPVRAKGEFEMAAKLDPKFPGSFLNLGRLALSLNDFPTAQSELEKAVSILPNDPKILSTLAYAQNGTYQYRNVLETVQRVHAVDHKGMADVHYVAAAAAMAIQDYDALERQLNFLLREDPTNAFAPAARQTLAALTHNKAVRAARIGSAKAAPTLLASGSVTFPNNDRLKAQLNALGNESNAEPCDAECSALTEANTSAIVGNGSPASNASAPASRPRGVWTIRTSVDDVAVFFSVSSHGHMINDLEQSDIQVRDDNKPPKKIIQFIPQSRNKQRLIL
jgi:tetratricopeptide (TPR) repeat protein